MSRSAEAQAGTVPEAAVRSARTRPMYSLVRREFWEHRALWIAPLAVSALLLLGSVFGRVNFPANRVALSPEALRALFAVSVLGFGITQYVTMSVVLWFYATDCLYAERRDRSILFWKSMPVSDWQTVASKALVAIVLVPLGVFAVTLVTSLIAFGIWAIRGVSASAPPTFWNTALWLHAEGISLAWLASATLWYAPITAYLLMVSAWARRNVQLWVLLPPLIAILVERIAFGTQYLSTWVLYRLGAGWQSQFTLWLERLFTGPAFYSSGGAGPAPPAFPGNGLHQVFGNVDLWLGLGVAVIFLLAAVRIRRYRDDT